MYRSAVAFMTSHFGSWFIMLHPPFQEVHTSHQNGGMLHREYNIHWAVQPLSAAFNLAGAFKQLTTTR